MRCSAGRSNFDLDPWGEATAAWQANTLLWRIERDSARRPITLTNANGERSSFVWDKLDRLIEQTDWTGTTERYQRDRAGQIIQIELIRNEQVILTQTNDLDKAGRVTRVQIQCGQNTYGARITYDAADQIIDIEAVDGASGGHSAVHWDRNPLGHIEQETQFLYGPDNEILWRHQVDHQHDELGNIVHTQLQGLPALHWQTYGPGYVHGLLLGQNSLIDFEHDKLHREIKRSLHAGKIPDTDITRVLNIESSYDKAGRLHKRYSSNALLGDILNREHSYQPGGQLKRTSTLGGLWKYPDPTINPKDFIAVGMDPRNIPTKTLVIPGSQWDYQTDAQQRLTRAQRTIQIPRMPGEVLPHPPEKEPPEENYYDPAGNRLFAEQRLHSEQDLWEELVRQNQDNPDFKAIQPRKLSTEPGLNKFRWPNNQVLDNGQYTYKHDEFGNVIEKWTQPNEKGETEHHYLKYNGLQQLIRHAVRYQQEKSHNHQGYDRGRITTYLYDPTGRRMVKQTKVYENGYPVSVPQTTFYGWDGNRQVLIEQSDNHIHTIYEPNSFVPLIRIEGKKAPPVVSLARKIKEHHQVNITAKSIAVIEQIERELRTDKLTKQHQQMLREIGLSVEELRKLLDPEPTLEGKTIHHFINDHLGTPQFLINQDLQIDWYREQTPWGKTITEFNLKNLHQPIRMQGQYYDEESGLHYNRFRYYDPAIGRYLTPDPIGLKGGLNPYSYAGNNPVMGIDPLGLQQTFASSDAAALDVLKKINKISIKENVEYAGMICQKTVKLCCSKGNKDVFFATAPKKGMLKESFPHDSPCPAGSNDAGYYHTHGDYSLEDGARTIKDKDAFNSDHFSGGTESASGDIKAITVSGAWNLFFTGYLGTPSGNFLKFQPAKGIGEERLK